MKITELRQHQTSIEEGSEIASYLFNNPVIKSQLSLAADIITISLLVTLTIYLDCIVYGQSLNENSLTEISQQLLLVITTFSFFKSAFQEYPFNRAMFLAGSFFAVLLFRELDSWFDHIAHGFWVYPALIMTFTACYLFISRLSTSGMQFVSLMSNKHIPMLTGGLMLLLVFSRLAGMGTFWKELMDEHYIRIVKNVVEEGTELLSYYFIALASLKITKSEL